MFVSRPSCDLGVGVWDAGRRKRFRVIVSVLARKKFDSSFMSLSPQVGYLVPLNRNFKEEASVPKFAVSDGINVIGRNNIPVPDKRLSRKHLTLTASPNGSASLLVVLTVAPYHSLLLHFLSFSIWYCSHFLKNISINFNLLAVYQSKLSINACAYILCVHICADLPNCER